MRIKRSPIRKHAHEANTVEGLLENLRGIQTRLLGMPEVEEYNRQTVTGVGRMWETSQLRVFLSDLACNSAALEGSRLKLRETSRLAEEYFRTPNASTGYLLEKSGLLGKGYNEDILVQSAEMVLGILDAETYMLTYSKWTPVSETMIREAHYLVSRGMPAKYRGAYRPLGYEVRIGGSNVKTSPSALIGNNMGRLLELQNNTGNPLVDAVVFHVLFETIHPFADGNGRTGRVLLNNMLPLPCILKRESGYFAALADFSWNPEHLLRLVVRSALRVQRSF